MRKTLNTYKEVSKLPAGALKISDYAREFPCSIPYVYKLFKTGKIQIVRFAGYNFVVPEN